MKKTSLLCVFQVHARYKDVDLSIFYIHSVTQLHLQLVADNASEYGGRDDGHDAGRHLLPGGAAGGLQGGGRGHRAISTCGAFIYANCIYV